MKRQAMRATELKVVIYVEEQYKQYYSISINNRLDNTLMAIQHQEIHQIELAHPMGVV